MSTFFTISGGNITTNNIFARTIFSADITSETNTLGIGLLQRDITTFTSDGAPIWGFSLNVKSIANNPLGYLSCKLYDTLNNERGSCIVPISNFPPGDGSDNFESKVSQNWQSLKFENDVINTAGDKFYLRLSASTDNELYLYGSPRIESSIIDYASNSDIVTTGSDMVQASFNPYNTKAWSLFLNDGAYLNCDSDPAFNFSTRNFTIDFWCYLSEVRTHRIVALNNLNVDVSNTNTLLVSGVDTGLTVSQNAWSHIAIVRTGNILNGYVDGVKSNDITIANNLNFVQASLVLGRDRATGSTATTYMHGHIYNFRIVLNQALYSTNFSKPTSVTTKQDNGGATPSTSPSIDNVGFLILDEKPYLDGINRQLVNGTLTNSVKNSPYNIYSTALELMSRPPGCNYIEIPIAMTTRPTWTVDGFWYPNSTGNNNAYFCDTRISNDASLVIYCPQNSLLNFRLGGTTKNTPIDPNGWNHVAVVYTNGVGDLYLNGTKTLSITSAIPILHDYIRLLNNNVNSITTPAGSISHFRVSNNARYTQDFTPPSRSVPPKKDANTIFLLGRKNSHIMADKMGKWEVQAPYRAVRLLGNAKGGVAEFGIFTDGTPGQILYVPQLTWDMNSDWTVMIEFSVHPDSFPAGTNGKTIFRLQDSMPNDNTSATMALKMESSGLVFYYSYTGSMPYNSLSVGGAPQNPNYGTFAAVYTSSTLTLDLYLNGSKVNSKVLTGPLFSPTTGGLSLFGGLNQTNYCKGYCSNFIVLNRKTTPVFSTNDYYYKDAVIWLDFNARTNSDFTNISMQTIGDISDSNIEVVGDFFNNSATSGNYKYSNVTPIVADSLPTYQSLAITPNYGNYPNVKLDYIDRPKSENYYISSSTDFTLESWVQTNTATNQGILNIFDGGLSFGLSAGKPFIGKTNGQILLSSISAVNRNDNLWHHLAVSRSSGNLSLFVDGCLSASTTDTTEFSAGKLRLFGDFTDSANIFDGYIADLRLTKGQALYTTTFTPPTATITTTSNGDATPSTLPLSSNVILLIANNPTSDPTSNIVFPVLNGIAEIVPAPSAEYAPFASEETYNPSLHGGSLYFDGNADVITVSERTNEFTLGTSDFTLEFWMYPESNSGQILDTTEISPSDLWDGFYFTTASNSISATLSNNSSILVNLIADLSLIKQWNHIAFTRKSSTYRLFINGKLCRTAYYESLNLQNDNNKMKIGDDNYKGYISDIRITKGQALYIEDFTPSTSTLTLTQNGATGNGAVALTTTPSTLIKGIGAGVYDGSANNTIYNEGVAFNTSPEIINSSVNYIDTALVFNGIFNNNYLKLLPSPSLDLTEDFWIDFWMKSEKWRRDTISRRILTLGSVSSVSAFHVGINATGNDKKIIISSNTGILTSNLEYADGNWHHVGIGRSGTTLSLYRDGVFDTSVTNNVNYNDGVKNNSYFGIYGDTTLNKGRFEGKILGMRIINGECVHTSSYTLPTGTATLISDGGTGTNSLGNVAYFQKLNNPIAPINSHMIVSQGQVLNAAVGSTHTIVSGVYKSGNVSSSSLPPNSDPNTSSLNISPPQGGVYPCTMPTSTLKMNGDWTIEFWMNTTASNQDTWGRMIMHTGTLANGQNKGLLFVINTNVIDVGMRSASNGAGNVTWISRITVPFTTINTWIHVALCKKNTNITLFLNGQRGGSAIFDVPDPGSFFTVLPTMRLGSWDIATDKGRYNGLLYNLRIIDGRALYDGATYTVPRPDSISVTVDTALLYNDARFDTFYRDSIDNAVIAGYLSGNNVITHTVSSNLDYNLNNISIQNDGVFTTPSNTNTTFYIINNGLKVGSGGKFILSASPGFRKVLALSGTKIQVLPGGAFEVYGQPKTKSVSLTGRYVNNLSTFAFDTTPTNWSANDSLIFLPTSADVTQFEELCARTVTTNRLSTFTRSSFAHEKYSGIPTVVNATRNVAIRGLSADNRGWLQFDKTSNTKICDVEFEHLGIDGATTESLIFNVKQGGSFLLSGCYLDGSSSPASIKATTFYKKSYNIDIRDNVFYKYTDSALSLNNVVNGIKVKNNLVLRSGNHGVSLFNATIEGDIDVADNISLGNTGNGLNLENAGGNISGWVNWMNTKKGASIVSTTKGEAKDLTDEDIIVTETSTSVTIDYDSPFINSYPDEYSTSYNGTIYWPANDKYSFKEDLTFEAFFKFTYPATIYANILFACDIRSNLGSFYLDYHSSLRRFELYTNEATNTKKLTVFLPEYLIGWNHIALCRKNGVFGIFVNGINVGTYNTFFEFFGTTNGINTGNFETSTNIKSIYGFRALTRAEYDPSMPTCTVPTSPFVVDNDTVMLYKRSIKSGSTNIQNIQNYYNLEGGMYIDNTLPSLKRTLIKNISSLNNTGFGFSLDGSNKDYRTANSLTATNIYAIGNTGTGLIMNNMTGLLTGIYAMNNGTTNVTITLGDGITNIKSLTALANNASSPNMDILNSKSLRPVIFDDIVLDKSSSFGGNYTGIPLRLGNTEFLNFHFDNSTLNTVSTGFAVTLSESVLGTYQFSNTFTTNAGVQNLSCLPPDNIKSGGIIFMNKNRNKGSHESFYRKGKRATDTSLIAGNIAEKITPNSLTDRFKSGSKFVAVSTNDTVKLKMKVTTTINGEARLMLKKNSSLGFNEDVLLYPISNSSTMTTTSPSASGVGIMEFYVDCTGTTGSVIIDDWKAK